MKIIAYMIRHKTTGQYSSGGLSPTMLPRIFGKLWRSPANLAKHLNLLIKGDKWPYEGCEVVSFEIEEIGTQSITDFVSSGKVE